MNSIKNVIGNQFAPVAMVLAALTVFGTTSAAEAQGFGNFNYIPSVIHNYDTFSPLLNSSVVDAQRAQLASAKQQSKEEKRAAKMHRYLIKHGLSEATNAKGISATEQATQQQAQ